MLTEHHADRWLTCSWLRVRAHASLDELVSAQASQRFRVERRMGHRAVRTVERVMGRRAQLMAAFHG